MDWNCPAFNEVLGKQLTKHHGNITVENTIRDVVSIVQTGNLQVAVYDLTKNLAYLSNAKASYESGPQYAYERFMKNFFVSFVLCLLVSIFRIIFFLLCRQYVRLNMTELFSEIPPEHRENNSNHWPNLHSYIINHHFLFPSSRVCFLDSFHKRVNILQWNS